MDERNNPTHHDLAPDEFQKYARSAIDWIVRYVSDMNAYPVLAQTPPGAIKSLLPTEPPSDGESFDQILADFQNIIMPGITHWNHPRFFAYFSITGSLPGLIGEMLSNALNVNAMLWKTSPAATELEERVLEWLRTMIGLPAEFEGIINDTASVSSLCAMAAAREAAGLDIRKQGMAARTDIPPLRVYISEESHSSIEKAAIVLGFGQESVRKIRTDDSFRMRVDSLYEAISNDIRRGDKPVCVVATIGTTSTTSIDPIKQIVNICRDAGAWLHIDAAYGGSAAVLPDIRVLFDAWDQADSIVVNPHKWLFTQVDCSVLYCRRPDILKQAFSLTPEYLKTAEADTVKNYMDYGVALGRRFRALKLWMVIRALGQRKIQNVIQEHIGFADKLASQIEAHPQFELLAPHPFSTLVLRWKPVGIQDVDKLNSLNEQLLNAVNAAGQVFMSHTKLRGSFGIRLAIGNLKTTWDDVALAWTLLQQHAAQIASH